MILSEYSQFGIAIFAIAALVFCIVKFLDFMARQEKNFKNTIDNHLDSSKKSAEDQTKMSHELRSAVKELLQFLRYYNNKNGKN
jgi:hypothetical protein